MCEGGWWRVCRRQRPPITVHSSRDMDKPTARGFLMLLMMPPFMLVMLAMMSMMSMLVLVPLEAKVSRVLLLPLAASTIMPRMSVVPLVVPGMSKVPVASWLTVWASRHRTTCVWSKGERRREDACECEEVPTRARLMSISLDPWRRNLVQSHSILPENGAVP